MITPLAVYLWVLGPVLLFLALGVYALLAGRCMRDVIFRAQRLTPTPSRHAPLINVVSRGAGSAERLPSSRPHR